ncbi:hypothetical protein [Cellulomonas iranensis]|uniref:hypothetical protein n=1 Tax=Cellulomonas iranensis TaxID=76862 RepID=UPI0013D1DCCA|nr:hypothetical protein [Cellulomonas iranensis]
MAELPLGVARPGESATGGLRGPVLGLLAAVDVDPGMVAVTDDFGLYRRGGRWVLRWHECLQPIRVGRGGRVATRRRARRVPERAVRVYERAARAVLDESLEVPRG